MFQEMENNIYYVEPDEEIDNIILNTNVKTNTTNTSPHTQVFPKVRGTGILYFIHYNIIH